MRLALAMIVKGTPEEAKLLSRCLSYTAPHVDDIYITATHKPGEEVAQEVWDVCNLFNAHTSKFEWCNDFAKARNFNFSQVKDADYILWLDADDVPRGIEKLKATIEQNPKDTYSLFYLYAFDEHKNPTVVHHKVRVLKPGISEWVGRLHEDFKYNRQIETFHIKDIEVLHLPEAAHVEETKVRNYEIAKDALRDAPDDPHSFYNLGNACYGAGKLDEALENFTTFLARSNSDDEKYIVRLRRAEVYWMQGKLEEALNECRYAIGTKPAYPDAYHLAGRIYYDQMEYLKAVEMFTNGLVRKPPYYSIVVYNPRDYDYVPLMNLAKAFYALKMPQHALPLLKQATKIVPADKALKKEIKVLEVEAEEEMKFLKQIAKVYKFEDKEDLKEALEKVPKKYHFHPEYLRIKNANFPKTESSGKDLVIFCGHTEEEWTPETIAKKGSGGSEEAIIHLSQGLHKLGWNVTVYNNCGLTEAQDFDGVTYKPYLTWNVRDKQDVVILWRNPGMLKHQINAPKVFVDMHDVIPAGEFTQDRIEKLTKVFFKSRWHRELYPQISEDKCVVLPNGIDTQVFAEPALRDPYLIINTASPVRSLSALVGVMKEVRKEIPEAKCKWAYGWTVTDNGYKGDPKFAEWKKQLLSDMKAAGIEDIGRLPYDQVAELYKQASVYAYPTAFAEIDCISVTKACAAGCIPVMTDFAALEGKPGIKFPSPVDKDNWCQPGQFDFALKDEQTKHQMAQEIIKTLKGGYEDMRPYLQNSTSIYNWENIINQWHQWLSK